MGKSPKEYLRQIRLFDICIRQKEAELAAMRSEIESMSAAVTGERVQTSAKDKMSEKVSHIVDLEAMIIQDKEKFLRMKDRIINEIQSLDDSVYVDILYKRYVEYKQLEEIAVEMSYSYYRMKHLHGIALQAFRKKYPKKFDANQER